MVGIKMVIKKKILLVFGTRPEAIKMAPLYNELKKNEDFFDTIVCVTAQHREMLDQVLSLFEITPDFDLNLMKAGQDLYDITSNVILGMRNVLLKVKPDIVFVHGDTTTSTATALSAFYQQIPVAHIEAGLRTFNPYSPFPEEMNRQITGRITKYHFSPTKLAKDNLLKENIAEQNIFVTGNTVIDSLFWVLEKIKSSNKIETSINYNLNMLITISGHSSDSLEQWKMKARKLILITGHRRENFGQGFINICDAIKELSNIYQDVDFVYPMHLNPNVRGAINLVFGQGDSSYQNNNYNTIKNVFFIEPLDYLPFVYLMNLSYIILTDSGGIQEEAPSLNKPVLVMRNNTERPEALDAGTVKLVGTSKEKIVEEVSSLINNPQNYNKITSTVNPYGDGKASVRIVDILKKQISNTL